jgi:hypothetical protein
MIAVAAHVQPKDYPAKVRRFDLCGRRVNSVLAGRLPHSIDCEMAMAPEELNKALGPARDKAARKLGRLNWSERFQIYWLYVAT